MAQGTVLEPAYVVRGHQVEAHQQALKERLDSFHDKLVDQLRRDAPDLLPAVEPPPPIAYGYQILPRVVRDEPSKPAEPHVESFSWPRSDSQISQQMTALDGLDSQLTAASGQAAEARHKAYEAIVADYKRALDRRRVIDANIDYNWLWQRQIANERSLFDRLTASLDAAVDQQKHPSPPTAGADRPITALDPPAFMRVGASTDHEWTASVPLYTDIVDPSVVEAFQHAIETYWNVQDGQEEYRIRLTIHVTSPERLYCAVDDAANALTGCAPPARGEHIDLEKHVARFPAGGAVLTTGAASLQLVDNRAIVLGPHDVAPRTLAHEFGHVLGFPDAYLRGYRDLGVDGFAVLEFVPDLHDIMSSPGNGVVLARHFESLAAAKQIQTLMQAGLDALYKQGNPNEGVLKFRQVLALNPDHYGATLQLAKALDQAGKPDEALPVWRKMLGMAEAAGDAETLSTVRSRLADTHP